MRQGRHLSWKVKLGRLLWQTLRARVRGGSSLEAGASRGVRSGATGPSGETVPRISVRVRKLQNYSLLSEAPRRHLCKFRLSAAY